MAIFTVCFGKQARGSLVAGPFELAVFSSLGSRIGLFSVGVDGSTFAGSWGGGSSSGGGGAVGGWTGARLAGSVGSPCAG